MSRTRKLAAFLVSDVVGYSRLAGADEERILARLRTLRSDLIDPIISVHHGRIVKRTGDGSIIEFRSVVDAVRCAIEAQNGMAARNAGVPADERIEYRVGVHLGDVVEESDGDLMGDGVNIASRLEGLSEPGRTLSVRRRPTEQVKSRLELTGVFFRPRRRKSLKNIARAGAASMACSRPRSRPRRKTAAPAGDEDARRLKARRLGALACADGRACSPASCGGDLRSGKRGYAPRFMIALR